MLIFFRNIPASSRSADFYKFIRPVMGNGFLPAFKKGRIVNAKIVSLLNTDTNTMEYHGLVRIEPDNVAQKVIKRLNRKPFKGVRINIREYHSRTWHNDPRTGLSSTKKLNNFRQRDRRRRNVELIDDINDLQFSSSSSFHRVL
jgi:hypothetical protein